MIKFFRELFADQERVSRLCMNLAIIFGLSSVAVLIGGFIFI
ncbi:hypothetical protein [uncultured Oxalicibacterium sp.]|nr:hypothetical protein [uncultured Oxalicibacterium sp.]